MLKISNLRRFAYAFMRFMAVNYSGWKNRKIAKENSNLSNLSIGLYVKPAPASVRARPTDTAQQIKSKNKSKKKTSSVFFGLFLSRTDTTHNKEKPQKNAIETRKPKA